MYPIIIDWKYQEDRSFKSIIVSGKVTPESAMFVTKLPAEVSINELPHKSALAQAWLTGEIVVHDPSTCAPFGNLNVRKVMIVPVDASTLKGFYWLWTQVGLT